MDLGDLIEQGDLTKRSRKGKLDGPWPDVRQGSDVAGRQVGLAASASQARPMTIFQCQSAGNRVHGVGNLPRKVEVRGRAPPTPQP